jgi:two-component system response regulator HydG
MPKILIIEDDMDTSFLLNRFLTKNGFEVSTANTGGKGIPMLDSEAPDVVLCDYRLGDMDGRVVLEHLNQQALSCKLIFITGYSDVKVAVEVMKNGAFDYVTKPLLPEEILLTIKKAIAAKEGLVNNTTNTASAKPSQKTDSANTAMPKYIDAKSKLAQEMYRQIDLVAQTNYSVIIHGESGTGKESVAARIHEKSKRASKPFIAVDCGALSKELAASELFGHEKGAFTGAIAGKTGCFELANGGTIFLDEIANLSYDVQVSLLRVVQERKVKKLGSEKESPIDVRIIVASNERLDEAVAKGKFREDLFYRFNEFGITIAPLRERKDDIMQLAVFFLEKAVLELDKPMNGFNEDVVEAFMQYNWPGNLRELNNVVKRSALLSTGNKVELSALPPEIVHYKKFNPLQEEAASLGGTTKLFTAPKIDTDNLDIKKVALNAEYELIMGTLQKVQFNKSKAAKLLNIDRKTLYNKMSAYGILSEESSQK